MSFSSRWPAVNAQLSRIYTGDPDTLPDAIACLYDAIATVPEPLLQEFETFSEKTLNDAIVERATRIANGAAYIVEGNSERVTLLDAAQLLRAFEFNAAEFSVYLQSERGEDLEDAWRTRDHRHYVVPRMTPLHAADGKPFLRRALRHFRVLPTHIDGFAVRLHRSSFVADSREIEQEREAPARHYGAALFPGLIADLAFPDSTRFTVAGVSGFDAEACISGHLHEARASGCRAVVWGELTMPEANVDLVRRSLAQRALEGCGPLRYLVAGSWHREINGRMRNVAQILDGYGEVLFEVLKWAKFSVAGKHEAIEPGGEVHVLIGEDELVVFAICRDFLQATTDVPYLKLNVDVAIVPSMITDINEMATLNGHAKTADTMRVRYGTRTLVVAQPTQPGSAGVGQVLALPAKPLEQDGRVIAGAWNLCTLASA